MASRDPYANTAKGKSTRVSKEESSADMKNFLTGLSYIVPVGLGLNALRLAYKGAKLGKTAIGLRKQSDAISKANKTAGAKQVKTKGERAGENKLARDRAKVAANKAAAAKTKAKTNAKMAGAAGATALIANSGKSKTTTPKKPTSTKTKTTGSGAAAVVPPKKKAYVPASKEAKQGNIGRTTTKYDTPKGKAKVAAKPKETKRKVGTSGMGHKAYQNLNFNRRK
mgnify:CR=1 FL=1